MTTEYRAKTFRSGNSLALRLPKGLGLTEGLEMIVREEQGRYIVQPLDMPRRKIDLTGISGLYPNLQPLASDAFHDPARALHTDASATAEVEQVRFLIDANCVIYLFSKCFPKLNRRIEQTSVGDIGLSTIVFAQLAQRSLRGALPTMGELERLVRQMPIVAFDEAAARGYGQLPFQRGRLDLLLAGHALSLDATIIAHDATDFAGIEGLKLEDWTK